MHLVQLRHTVDELSDLVAEILAQCVEAVAGVLHGVVQQCCGQSGCRHAQFSQDAGDRERVGDVRIARTPLLISVEILRRLVGPLDEPHIGFRVVLADDLAQRLQFRIRGALGGQAGNTRTYASAFGYLD